MSRTDTGENNENQFLTLEYVKAEKGIDDDQDDDILLPMIRKTNLHMSMKLKPVIDEIDLSDTKFFERAANVAITYFDYLYTRKVHKLYREAHDIRAEFEQDIRVFTESIKAEPTKSSRAKVASSGISAETRLTKNIPRMTDEHGDFIDEFGTS